MLSPFYRPPSRPRMHGTTLRDRDEQKEQEKQQEEQAEEQDTDENQDDSE